MSNIPTLPGQDELVVLVDDDGTPVGTAPKATVHSATTPLHRAFSCYLFDPAGRLLLTRRAAGKATFPGLWTNSVCGHPGPGESDLDAIRRRAQAELGVDVTAATMALARFRYRAQYDGLVENEICPVYLARTTDLPRPHPDEVGAFAWTGWTAFLTDLAASPARFSPWCREQARQLHADRHVARYLGAAGDAGRSVDQMCSRSPSDSPPQTP